MPCIRESVGALLYVSPFKSIVHNATTVLLPILQPFNMCTTCNYHHFDLRSHRHRQYIGQSQRACRQSALHKYSAFICVVFTKQTTPERQCSYIAVTRKPYVLPISSDLQFLTKHSSKGPHQYALRGSSIKMTKDD
jgi:hypothetical protein